MSDMSDFEQWALNNGYCYRDLVKTQEGKYSQPIAIHGYKAFCGAKQSMQGEAVAVPWMTNGLFVITFDDFVEYGRKSGGNIVNGMPWSFKFDGIPVTHETYTCYLLCRHPNDLRLTPNTVLIKFADGSYSVQDKNTTFSDYPFLSRLPTHAPDSAARIAEQDAEIARLKKELEEARKVPDGYALVPIEPTQDMIEAFNDKINIYAEDRYVTVTNQSETYKAMLAAAPDASLNIKGGA